MEKRNLLASSLGNVLEWLDVGLFIYLAPIIGKKFFPIENSTMATLTALGVFTAGFICRPLGSIVFGHLGDRIGRVKALLLSIFMMSAATLLIGLLPDYITMGISAPILLTLCRLLQGLSIGGEYSGIMIYLAESSSVEKRGFFTSFAAVGSNFGFVLATIIAILLNSGISNPLLMSWGWRIPFILSGALGFLIFFYRRLNLTETSFFLHLKSQDKLVRKPLLCAFKQAPKNLLQVVGLTCMGSTFYFVFFGYMPSYLNQYYEIPILFSLICQAVLLTIMLVLIPLVGAFGDIFGRKKILYLTALCMMIFSYFCFYLFQQQSFPLIFIGLGIATLISSLEQGSTIVTIVENFPPQFRYSGVSFAYHLGNTIFGGTAPLIVGILTQKISHFAPAYYLMLMAMISFIAIFSLNRRDSQDSFVFLDIPKPRGDF